MDLKKVILDSEALAHDANAYDYFVDHSDASSNNYMEPLMAGIAKTILGDDYDEAYSYKMVTDEEATTIIAIDKAGKIVKDFKLETSSEEVMSYNQMWDRVSAVSYERLEAVDKDIKHETVKDKSNWPMYIVLGLFVIGLLIIGVTMFTM